MRYIRTTACVLGLGLLLGACSDDTFEVPDLNNAGLEELINNPSRVTVNLAAQGLMIGSRAGIDDQGGFISVTGIFGRESLVFDAADPRWIDELVLGTLDAGSFGAFLWGPRYDNLRLGTTLLEALEEVVGFSNGELEAIRGWTKTFMALDLLLVINARDENGAVAVLNPFGEDLAPIESKAEVFNRIEELLTEAQGHLGSAGGAFPFRVSSGFAGFDTPATFQQVVSALQARVAVYREDYTGALNRLGASFLDPDGDFAVGAYHEYGTGQGENNNDMFQGSSPTIVAFPLLDDGVVQTQDDGSFDARFTTKVDTLGTPAGPLQGLTSNVRFRIYPSLSSPIPIIRNEELILLRAEARFFTSDVQGALEDLNRVRAQSGLDDYELADVDTEEEFIDALLYERSMSLIHEGGHRWIDHRRFDRLDELQNPRAGDQVPSAMPIPRDECLARGQTPSNGGCS